MWKGGVMPASRRVARAVSTVLNMAPRQGEVSIGRLVQAVAESRNRRIDIQMEELPPGVCGQWRQYGDHDVFLIQQGLPAWDRTLAHELGHLVLGHEGISVPAPLGPKSPARGLAAQRSPPRRQRCRRRTS